MNTNPIELDDLTYTDAHIFIFEGQPFTGVAESTYADGKLRCRFRFKNGNQHGEAEEYFPSGSKRMLTVYIDGQPHGRKTAWHENGVVQIERDIEYGILLHEKEFDESGAAIREYSRPIEDAMMTVLESRRRIREG